MSRRATSVFLCLSVVFVAGFVFDPTAVVAQRGRGTGSSVGDSAGPFGALRWRNIGPNRGGRSIAVAGSAARPLEYYFGATGGGLWKSVDGGATWRPVTDGHIASSSVGAVEQPEPQRHQLALPILEPLQQPTHLLLHFRARPLRGPPVRLRVPSGKMATEKPLSINHFG